MPPNHINLTAPQVLGAFVSSPSVRDNPFESPPSSPPLPFYTAPSTPLTSPQAEDPPLNSTALSLQQSSGATSRFTSPPHTNPLLPPLTPPVELATDPLVEAYPVIDTAADFTLDDEGLSTLEKIYLFSRSRSAHHRVFISHALPSFLAHVTPLEAVEYVLPLLPSLAMDEDEAVKEALASELVGILWWFLTRCRLVEESIGSTDCQPNYTDGDVTLMSVQAFTPILGTLLLSPNGMVSGPTRCAVVDLLGRMKKADAVDEGVEKDDSANDCGLFGRSQRKLFADEVLQQIVIGIGKLDLPVEEEIVDVWYDASARTPAMEIPGQTSTSATVDQLYDPAVNPYFPVPPPSPSSPVSPLPPCSSMDIPVPIPSVAVVPPSPPPCATPLIEFSPTEPPSPITSISFHYEGAGSSPTRMANPYGSVLPAAPHSTDVEERREAEDESDANEQAAVGRLSSMSLIAAVTAGGSLGPEIQRAFVREVERAGKDPVYWVRREASFALGALAKVVPEERQRRSSPCSNRCDQIRCGTSATPHCLHFPQSFPVYHHLYVVLWHFRQSFHFRGTNHQPYGPEYWKPLGKSCIPSILTKMVRLLNCSDFSWGVSSPLRSSIQSPAECRVQCGQVRQDKALTFFFWNGNRKT